MKLIFWRGSAWKPKLVCEVVSRPLWFSNDLNIDRWAPWHHTSEKDSKQMKIGPCFQPSIATRTTSPYPPERQFKVPDYRFFHRLMTASSVFCVQTSQIWYSNTGNTAVSWHSWWYVDGNRISAELFFFDVSFIWFQMHGLQIYISFHLQLTSQKYNPQPSNRSDNLSSARILSLCRGSNKINQNYIGLQCLQSTHIHCTQSLQPTVPVFASSERRSTFSMSSASGLMVRRLRKAASTTALRAASWLWAKAKDATADKFSWYKRKCQNALGLVPNSANLCENAEMNAGWRWRLGLSLGQLWSEVHLTCKILKSHHCSLFSPMNSA